MKVGFGQEEVETRGPSPNKPLIRTGGARRRRIESE
jgi:hypothetical protein